MKWIFMFFALLIMAPLSFAQTPVTAPTPAQVSAPAPLAAPTVAVPESAAPPAWATELLQTVSALPVVGPYISKALMYLRAFGACALSHPIDQYPTGLPSLGAKPNSISSKA